MSAHKNKQNIKSKYSAIKHKKQHSCYTKKIKLKTYTFLKYNKKTEILIKYMYKNDN